MAHTPICVSGQARCGTSLTMQMLHASGVPCYGEYPVFEPADTGIGRDAKALFGMGKAFKLIDPHRDLAFVHSSNAQVIWLDRDEEEQARSQVKMIETLSGLTIPKKSRAIRGMAKSIRKDRRICLDGYAEAGAEIFVISFETILAMPWAFAHDLRNFVRCQEFNEAAAANVVISRNPGCLPDMALELSLIERAS